MSIDNQLINEDARPRFIEMLQKQLIRENPSALPDYGVDGEYGPETQEWVTRFQERKGLQVDGIAGPETLGRLREDIIQRPGDRGNGIEILQQDLQYFYIEQTAVDGIYGSGTEQGVRDFQYYSGLTVDGVAGPVTLQTFDELMTTLLVQRGDENALVYRIQKQLNEQEIININLITDGDYGAKTEEAVETLQSEEGLTVDGIAGPRTMRVLDTEATQLMSDEEFEEAVSEIGIATTIMNDAQQNQLLTQLKNNSAYAQRSPEQEIDKYFALKVTSYDNDVYVLYVNYVNVPNISIVAFYSDEQELTQFSTIDIFGELYEDEITVNHYDLEGNRIDNFESTNIELDNEELKLMTEFQEAIQEASASSNAVYVQNIGDIALKLGCGTAAGIAGSYAAKGLLAAGIIAGPATFAVYAVGASIGAGIGMLTCDEFLD